MGDTPLPNEHGDIGRMAEEIRDAGKDDDRDEGDNTGTKKPPKVSEGFRGHKYHTAWSGTLYQRFC